MLTDEQVAEYQRIYKEQHGEEISREDALEQGIKLIRLMQLVYRPMTKQEQEGLLTRRNELGID